MIESLYVMFVIKIIHLMEFAVHSFVYTAENVNVEIDFFTFKIQKFMSQKKNVDVGLLWDVWERGGFWLRFNGYSRYIQWRKFTIQFVHAWALKATSTWCSYYPEKWNLVDHFSFLPRSENLNTSKASREWFFRKNSLYFVVIFKATIIYIFSFFLVFGVRGKYVHEMYEFFMQIFVQHVFSANLF